MIYFFISFLFGVILAFFFWVIFLLGKYARVSEELEEMKRESQEIERLD